MEDYRIRIRLKSPLGTPWQSDTIFGHLCWQVAYGVIDLDIKEFLDPFRRGQPPFVLSDGFPTGTLPRPQFGMVPGKAETGEQYAALKQRKKAAYFTVEDFIRVCHGKPPQGKPVDDPWHSVMTPHASLDRLTNTTGKRSGGDFYETESLYLEGYDGLDIYLRCESGWGAKVLDLFKAVAATGFGRDKSTGLGAFTVKDFEKYDGFTGFAGADGFVSLSSMVPAEADPADARYRLRAKYGKLGESSGQNPFKCPLLQMEPGAVFRADGKPKPYYGRLIEGIAPDKPEVVQNCYSVVVPCVVGV